MQEVFSKAVDPNVPLQEHECFELRLDDRVYSLGADVHHRFLVREFHAAWSEIDCNIMWYGFEHDECSNLHDAELSTQFDVTPSWTRELSIPTWILEGCVYDQFTIGTSSVISDSQFCCRQNFAPEGYLPRRRLIENQDKMGR